MPEEITFIPLTNKQIAVYLPTTGKRKKVVGHIHERKIDDPERPGVTLARWQYVPVGKKKGGEMFDTLAGCKRSLGPDYEPERRPKPVGPPLIPREQVTFTKALELAKQQSRKQ